LGLPEYHNCIGNYQSFQPWKEINRVSGYSNVNYTGPDDISTKITFIRIHNALEFDTAILLLLDAQAPVYSLRSKNTESGAALMSPHPLLDLWVSSEKSRDPGFPTALL